MNVATANHAPVATPPAPPPPANPGALSPDLFLNVGSGPGVPVPPPAQTSAAADQALSPTDAATLRFALRLLKAARAEAAGRDPAVAVAGSRQLGAIVNYLVGFCDSRGLTNEAPLSAGFDALFGEGLQPNVDSSLDELEAMLQEILSAPDTRLSWPKLAHALGDVAIAVGVGLIL